MSVLISEQINIKGEYNGFTRAGIKICTRKLQINDTRYTISIGIGPINLLSNQIFPNGMN